MSVAKTALKSFAATLDLLRPPPSGITLLIYHRVGAALGGEMTLDPETFRAQLEHLHEHHRVIPLAQAAAELSAGRAVEAAVVLTFDDGSADWIDTVLPLLAEHDTPATWYVTSGFVEAGELPDGTSAASWAGLRDAASTGLVTIGAHTHRHMLLDRLAVAEIGDELDRSNDLIAAGVGTAPRHFAYPKAVPPSADADAAVRARYGTAVLAGTRPNRAGADLHQLARSPIQASDGMRWFAAKARGGLGAEDRMRTIANRLRYRGRVD